MIPDEEIRKVFDAEGEEAGVVMTIHGKPFALDRYTAFRFSRFLDRAILDSCIKSGKKIDEGFAR